MAVQQVKTTSTLGYKTGVVVLVLIIIGLLAFNPFATAGGDRAKAEQNVVDLYKVITGSDVEILKTTEQNGVYKIAVRFRNANGQDTGQDVYVTRDGMFFTDRLLGLQEQKSLLMNQSAFAQCLFDRQVRIFGLSTDAVTQAQLQVLGAFSGRLYVDCAGQNLAICQQLNITTVPVIYNNGTLVQGPLNLNWFEQNAGCMTGANATG